MTLLSQHEIYKGYIFTECSLPYVGCFFVENRKSQKKDFSWVFTERITIGWKMSSLRYHYYDSEY